MGLSIHRVSEARPLDSESQTAPGLAQSLRPQRCSARVGRGRCAARPPAPAFAVEVARPAPLGTKAGGRVRGEGRAGRAGIGPVELVAAGSPRRARRFESFETNKCNCDRIFRKKISEGLRRNLGPRPCSLSTAPGNPGAFPVASRARRGGPLGRHGTGRRMPDPGRWLPRGGPPPWRPPAAPPI